MGPSILLGREYQKEELFKWVKNGPGVPKAESKVVDMDRNLAWLYGILLC